MVNKNEHIKNFKILLIGDSTVGKTSLLTQYTEKKFQHSYIITIGIDFKIVTYKHPNGETIKLQVWDTAGQERFHAITTPYYRGANGVIIVYDITNRKTFDQISDKWQKTLEQYASKNTKKILIGNKLDLVNKRTVTEEDGKLLADRLGIPFIEVSAKTGQNIKELFDLMVSELMKCENKNNQSLVKIINEPYPVKNVANNIYFSFYFQI